MSVSACAWLTAVNPERPCCRHAASAPWSTRAQHSRVVAGLVLDHFEELVQPVGCLVGVLLGDIYFLQGIMGTMRLLACSSSALPGDRSAPSKPATPQTHEPNPSNLVFGADLGEDVGHKLQKLHRGLFAAQARRAAFGRYLYAEKTIYIPKALF